MTVAVIGTGNMGSGIARLLASKGERVVIGSRDPAKAAKLAGEIGSGAEGGGIAAAAKMADVVIFAVNYPQAGEAVREAGGFAGKVLVDISNPITEDYKDLRIGHTTSAAEELQKLAPEARVVKAFNTIFAQLLPSEAREGRDPVQVFVAGDDEAAKKAVSGLASSKGGFQLRSTSGPLSNARYLEPVGEINIHFGFFLGWGTSAAPAWTQGGLKAPVQTSSRRASSAGGFRALPGRTQKRRTIMSTRRTIPWDRRSRGPQGRGRPRAGAEVRRGPDPGQGDGPQPGRGHVPDRPVRD